MIHPLKNQQTVCNSASAMMTQTKTQPLVFQKKEKFHTREILKKENHMAYGQHTFQMENQDGRDIKRKASIMDLSLCGMKMEKKDRGSYENGHRNMDALLPGTPMEPSGNNLTTLVILLEPGKYGMKKALLSPKCYIQKLEKATLWNPLVINLLVT